MEEEKQIPDDHYTVCNVGVIRQSDGATIPADPNNRDWKAYLRWLAVQ